AGHTRLPSATPQLRVPTGGTPPTIRGPPSLDRPLPAPSPSPVRTMGRIAPRSHRVWPRRAALFPPLLDPTDPEGTPPPSARRPERVEPRTGRICPAYRDRWHRSTCAPRSHPPGPVETRRGREN